MKRTAIIGESERAEEMSGSRRVITIECRSNKEEDNIVLSEILEATAEMRKNILNVIPFDTNERRTVNLPFLSFPTFKRRVEAVQNAFSTVECLNDS